jgi:hypothetical protein
MKIETTVTLPEQKEEEKKYPWFGQYNYGALVVCFYRYGRGIVIHQGASEPFSLIENINEAEFTPLPSGTIITMEVK